MYIYSTITIFHWIFLIGNYSVNIEFLLLFLKYTLGVLHLVWYIIKKIAWFSFINYKLNYPALPGKNADCSTPFGCNMLSA